MSFAYENTSLNLSFSILVRSIYLEENPKERKKSDTLQIRIKTLNYDVLNHTLLDELFV